MGSKTCPFDPRACEKTAFRKSKSGAAVSLARNGNSLSLSPRVEQAVVREIIGRKKVLTWREKNEISFTFRLCRCFRSR